MEATIIIFIVAVCSLCDNDKSGSVRPNPCLDCDS